MTENARAQTLQKSCEADALKNLYEATNFNNVHMTAHLIAGAFGQRLAGQTLRAARCLW